MSDAQDPFARERAIWDARLEAAAGFLSSECLIAIIEQAVTQAVLRAHAQVVNRTDAAMLLGKISETTFDGLVAKKLITPHYVGETPKFLREELLSAVRSGKLDLRPDQKKRAA